MTEGNFAKVYRGYTKTPDRQLRAVKTVVIEKDLTEGKDRIQIAWLAQEVEITRRVVHPNIVTLYEVVRTDSTINLIYEMMDCDLWELIRRNQDAGRMFFCEQECGYFIKQLLEAVDYLHSHHIVHRDIKPENILVETATNKLKLTDFGIAKLANSDVCTPYGTCSYMAPEIISGVTTSKEILKMANTEILKIQVRSEVKQIDIWSCGLLFFLLLVGKRPCVAGRTKEALLHVSQVGRQHGHDWSSVVFPQKDKHLWEGVAADAKELVVSLLQLDPALRPTSKVSLSHPFLSRCGNPTSSSLDDHQKISRTEVKTGDGDGDGDFALNDLAVAVNAQLANMRETLDPGSMDKQTG